MKKKILLVMILIIFVAFFSGITYSFFNSSAKSKSSNQGIASFIFETKKVDNIELDLSGLVPGDEREYSFSITNAKEEKTSDVTIEYQILIKTYHFIPLTISLYSVDESGEQLIDECDETFGRNEEKELVCNMPIETLQKSELGNKIYKLKVIFPENYNDLKYSNLVDYLNIEIESWQKI